MLNESKRIRRVVTAIVTTFAAALALGAVSASAEQGPVELFGTSPGTEGLEFAFVPHGLAINQEGTGGAGQGDIYALDAGNARVQVLTPSGEFVRAFGLDVGGSGQNVCTEAASCQEGTLSSAAGGFSSEMYAIAIDQGSGNVYVLDLQNARVNVFSAVGVFQGAFGWNVDASSPAEELQFCTMGTGCKQGTPGSGAGQISLTQSGNSSVGGIAFNPIKDSLLVTGEDQGGAGRIDEFMIQSSGADVTGATFARRYGWGVLNGASEYQTCAASCKGAKSEVFDCEQPPPGMLFNPIAVAVDQVGNVYVAGSSTSATYIDKLDVNSETAETVLAKCMPEKPEDPFGVEALVFDQSSNTLYAAQKTRKQDKVLLREVAGGGTLVTFGQVVTSFAPGLALNEASGTFYFAAPIGGSESLTQFGTIAKIGSIVLPQVQIDSPSAITGTTAAFSGSVNPKGLFTRYKFQYSLDGDAWREALTVSEEEEFNENKLLRRLPADQVPHVVSGGAYGLEGLTTYHVRLLAEKELGGGTGIAETTFTTGPAPPIVTKPVVVEISDTVARLTGEVNPENEETSYGFQCVTQADFASSGWLLAIEQPTGGTIAAAGESVTVSQEFSNLMPATGYLCRLIATNGTGSVEGEAAAVTTYATAGPGLPDGRVYEQATPIDKNGADARGSEYLVQAAPDGTGITFYIPGGAEGTAGSQEFPTYHALRGEDSWSSHGFLPPASVGIRQLVSGWSRDLRYAYVQAWNPGPGSTATFYRYDTVTQALREIASGLPASIKRIFADESKNGTTILFESTAALTSGAVVGFSNLYAWSPDDGEISFVSALPNGTASASGAFAGAYLWSGASPEFNRGGAAANMYLRQTHVLSDDGSRAVFTTSKTAQIYMRLGIGTPFPATVQVTKSAKTNGSGPKGTDPHGPGKAAFMEASPDGRYVLFTSPEELTNDATTGSADQGNDLYRYDSDTGSLLDLAPDSSDANGAEVQGVVGSSPDMAYVYFAANGVLAEGATAGTCKRSPVTGAFYGGECSLYLWHEGTIEFVARLGSENLEHAVWYPASFSNVGEPARTGMVSGNTVLFPSQRPLNGNDTGGTAQIFRFDPTSGLECVSCTPTKATTKVAAALQAVPGVFAAPATPQPFVVRSVVDEGNRIFFDTREKLVSADRNGVNDVYEWEAEGTGSCSSAAQNGGCLYLISTGQDNHPSYFADASENGDDVFIFTRQALVGQDEDELQDVYDARVGGGIPSQNPEPRVPCEGESCKGSASPAPTPQSAGSATFSGPGNPKPHKCRKGFVRKRGKCVKKPKRHKGNHGKHTKGKGGRANG